MIQTLPLLSFLRTGLVAFVLPGLVQSALLAAEGNQPTARKYTNVERLALPRLKAVHEDVLKLRAQRKPLDPLPGLNDYRCILHAHAEDSSHTGGTLPEMLADAKKAGIHAILLTDHFRPPRDFIDGRWRGFKDVADSRHLGNRVEREVVEALVSAVRGTYASTAHRYYALKARWLGKPKLAYWDRNAPLPNQPDRLIAWKDAEGIVLAAYAGFAPKMAQTAKLFFDGAWIDAPVREGKSPGAFSHPTVPSAHPYILLNYQGKARDVMVLAHELGHGVHQVLAAPQGPLLAPTPLTLAETASVFGEILTFQALLD